MTGDSNIADKNVAATARGTATFDMLVDTTTYYRFVLFRSGVWLMLNCRLCKAHVL
jgi:hypothetical protein